MPSLLSIARLSGAALAVSLVSPDARGVRAQDRVASAVAPRADTATASAADRDAVRRAVLDYVEGFYEGDTAKLVRGIRPEVFKYGFWRPRDATAYSGERMTWAEILDYARKVKASGRAAPATAPKVVEIFDVQDQTASAKLTAFWGTDYLLLGKYDGRWMIANVMWQSKPLPRRAQ
jgi:hypothetical protein